jgi:hypothetical protein
MSDLTSSEKRRLEQRLRMKDGYVLDFGNRTFRDFMHEHAGLDIYDDRFQISGGSKANLLRTFWRIEPNHVVAKVVEALVDFGVETRSWTDDGTVVTEMLQIAARLRRSSNVPDVDAFAATVDRQDFEAAARLIRDAIEKGEPETALDRLHVFTVKFMRVVCEPRGIEVTKEKPLHSLMGEYVKKLRAAGHLESDATDRILKGSISLLEGVGSVRNEQSLAHDNPLLHRDEALLIVNHVAATIQFIKSLESRLATNAPAP